MGEFKDLTPVEKISRVYRVFTNNGYISDMDDDRATIKDFLTSEDIRPLIPKVVKKIIVEALEPNLLVIPNLFTKVNLQEGQMIEIGAIGSISAGKVAQGGDYPTSTLAMDIVGSTTSITVSKYGCAINIAKEVLEENQFDIITLWLRAAGSALARLKEALGLRLINEFGINTFDNSDPESTEYGICTGRDITGAHNGTMTLNDIFDMWVYLALRGFTPDTLMISPLAWKVFATDPQLREIVIAGAVLVTRRMPLGSSAMGFEDIFHGLGLYMKGTGNEYQSSPWTETLTPVGATLNVPPRYLPGPVKVLVSHLMPFATRTGKQPITDIALADSQRCGILVQREGPTTEELDILTNDTHHVHVYERYGMGIFDQGKGIAMARNVVVDRNYVFENTNMVTLTNTTSFPGNTIP